jgi:hypothetical protein
LGGAIVTGFVYHDSSLAYYSSLALVLLALGLATWIGWAPVLAAPGPRAERVRALGAAALRSAGRRARALAHLAAHSVLFGAIILLSTGEWLQGGLALLVGLALLPMTWRWLSRVTGWAVAVRTRRAVGERPGEADELQMQ